MAGVDVVITGPYAYLTREGDDRPRPVSHGETVTVSQTDADDLVANGIGRYADAESAGESENVEDKYSEMDLAALRAAAADLGIEGMERATTKTVLAALREQESAGESETRIGSGDRR